MASFLPTVAWHLIEPSARARDHGRNQRSAPAAWAWAIGLCPRRDRVTIGAIVPDEVASWSELMVSPGRPRLGVQHDRFACWNERTSHRVAIGPHDRPLLGRATTPGPRARPRGVPSPGRRGRPPILMKEGFGEFAAYPIHGGRLPPHACLVRERHLLSRHVPLLGRLTCHELIFRPLMRAMARLRYRGSQEHPRLRGLLQRPHGDAHTHRSNLPSFLGGGGGHQLHLQPIQSAASPTSGPDRGEAAKVHLERPRTVPDGMHFEYAAVPGVG